MEDKTTTPFSDVYDSFLSKITDDMYMELTKEDTYEMLEDLLMSSIPKFEFPRVNLADYVKGSEEQVIDEVSGEPTTKYKVGFFNTHLTFEEINILATYMIVEWLGQQIANVEMTRMKYSGTDFKFTSQANHIQKLLTLKKDYEREGFHLQRLYKRRAPGKDGIPKSTLDIIMTPLKERSNRNEN